MSVFKKVLNLLQIKTQQLPYLETVGLDINLVQVLHPGD